jgi:hypothetical protein
LIIFVAEQKEEVFNRLDKMFLNLDTGMTREKYLKVCEQLNKEPKDKDMPPDLDDFPELVQEAVATFNMLGDRIYPDIGYVGKDYTNLPVYLDLYEVKDREFFLQVLAWLDSRAIKKSSEALKREHEKLKRKSRG